MTNYQKENKIISLSPIIYKSKFKMDERLKYTIKQLKIGKI